MKKTVAFIIVFFALILPASAQKMTSYAPAKFNFTSEPAGAEVYFDGKLLGTTPLTAEVKPAYRTQSTKEGSSEFEIYSANTIIIEREINESGKPEGILSRFALEFTFNMPDGSELKKTVQLMWKPVTVLGQQGISIYYPSSVKASVK